MSYNSDVCEVSNALDARSDGSSVTLRRDASPPPSRPRYSIERLADAGFTPQELKDAGCNFSSLKAAGFNLKQLKDAGFTASAFESDGCSVAHLREIGFTARELLNPSAHAISEAIELQSSHHDEIKRTMREKLEHAHIFGHSWQSFLGFFAPFGCANSFWNRLKKSQTFKHVFVYDEQCVQKLSKSSLCDQLAAPRVAVADVDALLNNICLICALVLGCPLLVMGEISGNEGRWTAFMHGLVDESNGNQLCLPSPNFTQLYSDYCLSSIQHWFKRLYVVTLLSFYSALATLNMALFFYMCRPSESCNIASNITLLEAFTLEVRRRIRRERYSTSPESEKSPSVAFETPVLESEVFLKASYLAQNEAEEQNNSEFYVWYRSPLFLQMFLLD